MSCTAAFNQKAFRGRNDDGNETTATWKANQNTNWNQAKDTNFRIRLEVQETAGCAKANFQTIQLQYNRNGLGWNNVTDSSTVVRSTASPNLADAANTTDQLTVGTGTFVGGAGFDEVNGVAGSTAMDVATSGHFEVEYCVQIRSADVASGDTVQLRVTDGGSAFAAYDATPSVTVSSGNVTVTPTTLALTTSTFAPTVQTPRVCTPTTLALTTSTFAPTIVLGTRVVPATLALTTSTFAPTVSTPRLCTPTTVALTTSTFAPTIVLGTRVVPATLALTISTFAPTVTTASGGTVVTPSTAALTTATFAPTIQTPRLATPTTTALTLEAFAPTVSVTSHVLVTPPTATLAITFFAPTITDGSTPPPAAQPIVQVRFGAGGGPRSRARAKRKKKKAERQLATTNSTDTALAWREDDEFAAAAMLLF